MKIITTEIINHRLSPAKITDSGISTQNIKLVKKKKKINEGIEYMMKI